MDKQSYHDTKDSDKKPFDLFYDYAVQRLETGGICENDYVEIIKVDIKEITTTNKERLLKMKNSDLNIRVCRMEQDGNTWLAEIGEELGMGLFKSKFVIPIDCLKLVSKGIPNGLPDSWYSNKGEDKGFNKVEGTIL